jgi:hypothetical protein
MIAGTISSGIAFGEVISSLIKDVIRELSEAQEKGTLDQKVPIRVPARCTSHDHA